MNKQGTKRPRELSKEADDNQQAKKVKLDKPWTFFKTNKKYSSQRRIGQTIKNSFEAAKKQTWIPHELQNIIISYAQSALSVGTYYFENKLSCTNVIVMDNFICLFFEDEDDQKFMCVTRRTCIDDI